MRGALFSLLPTPCARDWKGEGYEGQLPTEMLKLLPTPTSASYKQGGTAAEQTAIKRGLKLLPTPTSMDGRGSRGYKLDGTPYSEQSGVTLTDAALSTGVTMNSQSGDGKRSSAGLALNPWFVEWMMGAPEGWSDPDCPLSATEFSSRQAGSADAESWSTR